MIVTDFEIYVAYVEKMEYIFDEHRELQFKSRHEPFAH